VAGSSGGIRRRARRGENRVQPQAATIHRAAQSWVPRRPMRSPSAPPTRAPMATVPQFSERMVVFMRPCRRAGVMAWRRLIPPPWSRAQCLRPADGNSRRVRDYTLWCCGPMAYRIQFSPQAREHLAGLPRHRQKPVADAIRQQPVADAIRQQLTHEPLRQVRNRFPMRANDLATWELRVDPQRVYYDVEEDVVRVQAIGTKRGNKVFIGSQEVDLGE
jgi:mRNA-degrading endonuclease RelE of RelBE toxin-antitoxin system